MMRRGVQAVEAPVSPEGGSRVDPRGTQRRESQMGESSVEEKEIGTRGDWRQKISSRHRFFLPGLDLGQTPADQAQKDEGLGQIQVPQLFDDFFA